MSVCVFLLGFYVGCGEFSGWIGSGWGGFEFQTEMSGTFHISFLVKFGLWMFFLSWIKVRFGSRVSGRYFVFCLSLRFKAGVERLIGIFFSFLRPKVFKVTFSPRVLGYGLRLWNCMGWGGGPSSRLSGFTEILTQQF